MPLKAYGRRGCYTFGPPTVTLLERRLQLVDAFVYDKSIDSEIYQEQLSKLQLEIGLKELEVSENRQENLNPESILKSAMFVISNPEMVWKNSPLNQRQRFQRVLFPKGLRFGKGGFGTSETAPIYKLLSTINTQKDTLVAPRGIEPRFNG